DRRHADDQGHGLGGDVGPDGDQEHADRGHGQQRPGGGVGGGRDLGQAARPGQHPVPGQRAHRPAGRGHVGQAPGEQGDHGHPFEHQGAGAAKGVLEQVGDGHGGGQGGAQAADVDGQPDDHQEPDDDRDEQGDDHRAGDLPAGHLGLLGQGGGALEAGQDPDAEQAGQQEGAQEPARRHALGAGQERQRVLAVDEQADRQQDQGEDDGGGQLGGEGGHVVDPGGDPDPGQVDQELAEGHEHDHDQDAGLAERQPEAFGQDRGRAEVDPGDPGPEGNQPGPAHDPAVMGAGQATGPLEGVAAQRQPAGQLGQDQGDQDLPRGHHRPGPDERRPGGGQGVGVERER